MAGPDIRRLYYSTREVCKLADIRPYDLKQWEKKYTELKPSVSKTGRRMYKPHDLEIVGLIKYLLDQGKSEDEINYLLNHQKTTSLTNITTCTSFSINEIIHELEDILSMLKYDKNSEHFDLEL